MQTILRWIAVLPGSILFAFLGTILLDMILFQTLTGSGFVDPYPEMPERMLTPLVVAVGFVWAGWWIAPHHKVETAVVLFGVWELIAVGFLALGVAGASWFGHPLTIQYGGVAPAGAMVGAFVGLCIARHPSKAPSAK